MPSTIQGVEELIALLMLKKLRTVRRPGEAGAKLMRKQDV